jgi:hypothetical protein
MAASRYQLSLRIWHPSMDPREITETIGTEPHRSWKAGDPRRTPVDRPLPGVNRESYWYAIICEGHAPTDSLAIKFESALDGLAAHKEYFSQIRQEGGRAEFFIVWYLRSQAGTTLPHSALRKLAGLGIDLSLDNYHDPELPEEE